eukprot:gene5420-9233_t
MGNLLKQMLINDNLRRRPSSGKLKTVKKEEHKLLLLGTGESGKSTIFLQLKQLISQDEIPVSDYDNIIPYLLITNTIVFIKKCQELYPDEPFENKESLEIVKSFECLENTFQSTDLELHDSFNYDNDLHQKLVSLWKDKKFLDTFYLYRYDKHVFIQNLEKFTPRYKFSFEDIINCRKKTLGIVNFEFNIKNFAFNLVDVGGQQNERKKWKNCFKDVSILIYVASLSDYDQNCYEDSTKNRMLESLEVFEQSINGEWFRDTPIILILNKKDVLEKKMKDKNGLKDTFSDYEGGQNFENAIEFIKQKFRKADQKKDLDRMSIHLLQATDLGNVQKFYDEIEKTLLYWVDQAVKENSTSLSNKRLSKTNSLSSDLSNNSEKK